MLPRFPAGAGTREIGSKRKGKRGKEEFLNGKCNQAVGISCALGSCAFVAFVLLHIGLLSASISISAFLGGDFSVPSVFNSFPMYVFHCCVRCIFSFLSEVLACQGAFVVVLFSGPRKHFVVQNCFVKTC